MGRFGPPSRASSYGDDSDDDADEPLLLLANGHGDVNGDGDDDAPLLLGAVAVEEASVSGGSGRAGGARLGPAPAWRWAVLLALDLVFVMVHAHRQLLAVLIPAGLACGPTGSNGTDDGGARDCVELTDAEVGVLLGPAFTVPFVVCGLPISWAADRHSRVVLLAACAVAWTTSVLATAWATSFVALLLLRAVLGAFQAGCNPCAYVMLSEHFPDTAKHRSAAFGLYHTGVYVGTGLSYFAGGVSQSVGWRTALIVYASAGYVVTTGLAGVREHPKGGGAGESDAAPSPLLPSSPPSPSSSPASSLPPSRSASDTPIESAANKNSAGRIEARLIRRQNSLTAVTMTLARCRPFCWLCAGASVTMLCRFALAAYLPALYEGHFKLEPGDYGLYVGLSVIVGGSVSSAVGGKLTDRFRTDSDRALVCALSQWLPLPFWLGALLAPTKEVSFVLLFLALLLGDAYLGVAVSMLQLAVPRRLRSRASMYYLALNTLSGGCGPLVVGLMLQYSGVSLQAALATTVAVCLPVSGVFFMLAGRASDGRARAVGA